MSEVASSLQIEVGSSTDIGCVRRKNEDSYRVASALDLFVVSDGMGGGGSGEVASAMAVETMVAYCHKASADASAPYVVMPRPGLSERTNRLADAVHLANRKIHEAAVDNPLMHGMGATVVAAWLGGLCLSVVNVGDSRAYLLRSGKLERLTSDHTLVDEQVRLGILTPQRAVVSALRNVLIRALGAQANVDVDAYEHRVLSGDVLLLSTDGLPRMVPDEVIARTLLNEPRVQNATDSLVALAKSNGGYDNISVIVVRIGEETYLKPVHPVTVLGNIPSARAAENEQRRPTHLGSANDFRIAFSLDGKPPSPQIIKVSTNQPVTISLLEYLLPDERRIASQEHSLEGESIDVPLSQEYIAGFVNAPRPAGSTYDSSVKFRVTASVGGRPRTFTFGAKISPVLDRDTVYWRVFGSEEFVSGGIASKR